MGSSSSSFFYWALFTTVQKNQLQLSPICTVCFLSFIVSPGLRHFSEMPYPGLNYKVTFGHLRKLLLVNVKGDWEIFHSPD